MPKQETRGENGNGDEVYLGTNADSTKSTLPPFVNIGGVHVDPSRVEAYIESRIKMGLWPKNNG